MAIPSQGLRAGLQIVLALVIVALSWLLYESITEPWEQVERQEALEEATRERMTQIRQGLIAYESRYDRYPGTLDSLLFFVRDSLSAAQRDSVFEGAGFMVDSLLYSPRTGNVFAYAVNDTLRVPSYLLEDPDSDDYIGTLENDITQINAASWE